MMRTCNFIFALGGLVLLGAACERVTAPPKTIIQEIMPVLEMKKPLPEPEWAKSATIYQINTRQFSPAGNLAGIRKQLPRLRELGVDILWLMPLQPVGVARRKGTLGSPYSIRDYRALSAEFGTMDEFKQLVDETHASGMHLILDWVPNHTAWDHVWMTEHPDFYTRYNGELTVPLDENGVPITDWSDVADLDYGNPAMRKAMIEAMQYWLRETDIDGFRVDMATLLPNDFWPQLRPALDSVKTVFMLGEGQDHPEHFEHCFNANYGWKWKDVTKDIANGRQEATSLDTLYDFLEDFYPKGYYQMYFTQNHDENTWNGTEKELYGDAAEAFNVLAFTWQGIPLIYNGQEDALDKRLAFFERDPIRWKKYAQTPFFKQLVDLRHRNSALWSGIHGGKLEKIRSNDDARVYAFYRGKGDDKCIGIFNFSKQPRIIELTLDNNMAGAYMNVFGNSTVQVGGSMDLTLKPWEYLLLSNR
jgi:glycosidase